MLWLICFATLLTYQNCDKKSFSAGVDPEEKAQVLGDGGILDPVGGGDVWPPSGPTTTLISSGASTVIWPVTKYCSTKNYSSQPRVVVSDKVVLKLRGGSGQTLCEDSAGAVKNEIMAGRVNLTRCLPQISSYSGSVYASLDGFNASNGMVVSSVTHLPVSKSSLMVSPSSTYGDKLGSWSIQNGAVTGAALDAMSTVIKAGGESKVLYDYYLSTGSFSGSLDEAECDKKSSPLFVDMRGHPLRGMKARSDGNAKDFALLTSPWDGVMFDIMGEFASPVPHTPMRISWFRDPRLMPVVLPDKDGKVSGIDQLFGNNTIGPDGLSAANGYAALAKYDAFDSRTGKMVGEPDGMITFEDPIYKDLRLWFDRNLDGQCDPGELIPLEEAGVQLIDLDFDPHFREVDRYGNEILYKSVVKMRDNSYRLIFDVWFRLTD
ncbi:MAG: hypothetical protein COT73_09320 [Bdellovibrio sp. CG10_big_fil_rev_8_21_14_0_10_47_8]|nr:MAG: hypothetical protein COT73_09320 [Bdellovibrio sp. CG10_big_fil_rev_8_21_14_0_10_47_8]